MEDKCKYYKTCPTRQALIKIVSEGNHEEMSGAHISLDHLKNEYCQSGEADKCLAYDSKQ